MQLQNQYVPWQGSFLIHSYSHSPYNLKFAIIKLHSFTECQYLPPRLFTTQVKTASRPWATVTFSKGKTKSGSNADTDETRKKGRKFCKQNKITTQSKSNGFIAGVFIVASHPVHTKFCVILSVCKPLFLLFVSFFVSLTFLHIKNSKVKIK